MHTYHIQTMRLMLDPVYTEGKRIYFHAVWPFIYTKTEVLSRKTNISENSVFEFACALGKMEF